MSVAGKFGKPGSSVCTAILAASILTVSSSAVLAAKTTLTIAMWRNDPPTAKFTQGLLNDYSKKNNVNIKFVYVNYGGFLDKLLAMTAAGQVPDVVVLDRRWLPRFADNKLVRPLDDVVAAEKFDPMTKLSEKKSGYYKKKFYGFPIWGGPALHYYNPALFISAGVPDPNQLAAANRWTWDTFLDAGRKLTRDNNGDGKPDVYGLNGVSTWTPDWVTKVRSAGGDIFNDTYTKVLVNQPAAIEGIQFWSDLVNRYNIAPRNAVEFGGKKAAMQMGWLSEAVTWKDAYKKRGIDMQLTINPVGKAGNISVAGGCPVCVTSSTKNFKEAYKLAKWFAMESDEWKNTGAPASRAIYEGAYQEYLSKFFQNIGATLRRSMENTDPEPSINPRHQLIEPAMVSCLAPVLTGKVSAAQGAAKLADELTRIISRK